VEHGEGLEPSLGEDVVHCGQAVRCIDNYRDKSSRRGGEAVLTKVITEARRVGRARALGQVAVAVGHEDGPIDDDEHEAVHVHQSIEETEVETASGVARSLLRRLHQSQELGFPRLIVGVDVGPVEVRQGPRENDDVVGHHESPGYGRELKDQAPARVFVVLSQLEVRCHPKGGHHVGEDGSADVAEHILVEPLPWRVSSA